MGCHLVKLLFILTYQSRRHVNNLNSSCINFFRCGALHVGDHVLTIDGIELSNMSEAEAKHFLVSGTSKLLQLEILPVGHLYTDNPTLIHPDRGVKRGSNAVSGNDVKITCFTQRNA